MRVLIVYPLSSEIVGDVIYCPEVSGDEEKLRSSLKKHHPDVLIVGNNSVGDKTLQLWRELMKNERRLTLIRRGSSLSRIDLNQSQLCNIQVLNTLSVNSRFVVDYMIEHLHLSTTSTSTIGIVGSGAIGSRIASRLNSLGHQVKIYSPSLTIVDRVQLEKIRLHKGLGNEQIRIGSTAEEVLDGASHVILAIDAERVIHPEEKLSIRFVRTIGVGARLISVSEFRVFADGALDVLVERVRNKQFTARLDSHRFDLLTIQDPPEDLQLVSEAMTGKGCAEAMDQAVFIVLANLSLQQTFQTPTIIPTWKHFQLKEEVAIVGAGILGLITAFVLSQNGYRVTVLDEHEYPNDKMDSCRGTTLDGCDARHASVTETMPHALFYRKDSLKRKPSDRSGWKIFDGQAEPNELLWMERFSQLAGYPELTLNLINHFVSNLNRRGIELWEEIFRHYPTVAGNAVRNRRILRVCPSLVYLNVVSTFQMNYHFESDQLQRYSRAQVLEKLPNLGLTDGDAGAIEVPGFTINVLQLCTNLISYLQNHCNVTFHWSKSIRSSDDLSSLSASKIIFASSTIRSDMPIFDKVNLAVQGVAGCWTKLVNTHSRTNGFKITKNDPLGILNVTPTSDGQHLVITGGFGYCGQRGLVSCAKLDELVELFQTAIREYLHDEYEASESETRLIKFCIRPMTPDGMPILAQLNDLTDSKQQVYFLGGTNAGGFVQAPVLATLLADLFLNSNNEHNFSHIYRSLRLDRNTLKFN